MEARRRAQLTGTNLSRDLARSFEASLKRAFAKRSLRLSASQFAKRLSPFGPNSSDGHGGAAPPLPIPNRIVKRPRADDSGVLPCESRSPSDSHLKRSLPGAFRFYPFCLSPAHSGSARVLFFKSPPAPFARQRTGPGCALRAHVAFAARFGGLIIRASDHAAFAFQAHLAGPRCAALMRQHVGIAQAPAQAASCLLGA